MGGVNVDTNNDNDNNVDDDDDDDDDDGDDISQNLVPVKVSSAVTPTINVSLIIQLQRSSQHFTAESVR